jgi:type III pantothenate kinase
MSLLAIDIGNTGIKVGLFDGSSLEQSFRLSTVRERTADEYCVFFKGLLGAQDVEAAIAASVVPPVGAIIDEAIKRQFNVEPVFVSPVDMELMPLEVDYPAQVGVDRVVNCYAAIRLYGTPLIVIDFGTGTTFDVLSGKGTYLGGAIAAGAEIAAEALHQKAALLPKIRLKKPDEPIGKNTRTNLRIGLYEGLLGQIDFIVRRFWKALGQQAKVIATGGLAEEMTRECPLIDQADPQLTLKGLEMIYRDRISG